MENSQTKCVCKFVSWCFVFGLWLPHMPIYVALPCSTLPPPSRTIYPRRLPPSSDDSQTLYESAVAFGMRKALQTEQGKNEMEQQITSQVGNSGMACALSMGL